MELITVAKAKYVDGYRIEAVFSNGIKKLLDFTPIVKNAKGVVSKLADKDYFKNFTLDPFTMDWNNEIGFDPQDLYERGITIGYDGPNAQEKDAAAEPSMQY